VTIKVPTLGIVRVPPLAGALPTNTAFPEKVIIPPLSGAADQPPLKEINSAGNPKFSPVLYLIAIIPVF
jgi:hypothetical protein